MEATRHASMPSGSDDLSDGLLDAIPHMVWLAGPDGRGEYYNQQIVEYSGLPQSAIIGSGWEQMVHPDDLNATRTAWAESVRTGTAFEIECRLRRFDGAYQWHVARGKPQRESGGPVVRWVGTCTDVDRLKRAEAAVSGSEAKFRAVVEKSYDAVDLLAADGTVLYTTPAGARVLGYTPAEHVGTNVFTLVHPDDRASVEDTFRQLRVAPGGSVESVCRARRVDGSFRWLEFRCTNLLDDPAVCAVVVNYRDMTDRMAAEADARAARAAAEQGLARLRTVVQSMTDGLITADRDGNLLDWNVAAVRTHGFASTDDARRHLAEFTTTFVLSRPGEAPLPFDEWPMVRVLRGETLSDYELRVRRLDLGWERIISYSGAPVRGPDGAIELGVLTLHDVTDRRRAEADLWRTAELLRAVADNTPDAVFVKDRDGRYLFFNPAAARFVGRPAGDVIGRTDAEVFDPKSARRIRQVDSRVMERGQPETVEEALTADGETRTYLATKAPYRDETGAVIGLVGISRDVSAKRRLAAERDALLDRLQLYIARLPLAYVLFDADLRITDWNPAAERLFGYTRDEALALESPLEPLIPAAARPVTTAILRRIRAGDMTAHSVNDNVTKDGRTITCEWYNTPLLDAAGRFTGLLCLVQDVTARRAAEEALRLRDRAIQAVTQGILITDASEADCPIVYVSPGFERLTGYAAEHALGRNGRFLQGKDTDPAPVALLREAVRGGLPRTVELLNYRADGTSFWNELSISPVRDDTGAVTHFVGVQTDVTARRRLEEQFRQAQKMEAVGRLAGGIAHDFNNLLTVINGYSELLFQSLPPGSPARELLAEIQHAGERSAGLTRQLLAFSRKQVLAPRVLDLNDVIADAERLLRRVIGEDVGLETVLAPSLAPVRADPGQLEQVLMNLVVNARDAMPRGGRVVIETRNVDQAGETAGPPAAARPGPYVLLAVTDTGHGMTPEVMARVFEPFFTTKEPGKGTGLGLATVYGIVRQSGGLIDVSSGVGAGTTFTIYLPRAEPAARAVKTPSRLVGLPRGTETVLLVEDDAGVRTLARSILARCGYSVLEAANGAEAVQVAAGHPDPIHLLVTDVVMPGLGGREVAERVSRQCPGVRVLFMSGYTDDAVLRHGVMHESVNFLQKPFVPAALAHVVREVLDRDP